MDVLLMVIILCSASLSIVKPSLGYHFPTSSSNDSIQTIAARAVVQRLLKENASFFMITVNRSISNDNKDTFQIIKDSSTGTVNVTGSSGVAACWGVHHYLKHYCHCQVSWDGDQLDLPDALPDVSITVTAVDLYRYYQNVVTTSYSFVWWDWNRWQREIDWMALNGINLALAFTGQEAIWERVYTKLNLTQTEIQDHFCGPAFLAWCRMGNIRGWGGPLSHTWHSHSLQLQHLILQSMRKLGMLPILPAFAGHVPKAFERLFPNANMTRMNPWNAFLERYCCPYLLEPTEPLFRRVGNMFITELIAEFGTDHFYNCDTFNEMSPRTGSLMYLRNVGTAIFQALTDIDSQAIWVLQGWLFANEAGFWIKDRANAFLTSVPLGRMIVLDLQSEVKPQYIRLSSYFGQPFIWCMLHNFGGTLGLYGAVQNVNSGIFDARSMNRSTMIGIGLTPEGINQNYVMYDLVFDLAWRTKPVNLTSWISSYAKRRYGHTSANVDTAWQLLKSGVYNFTGLRNVRGKYIICRRPSLRLVPWYWYNTTELKLAWDRFINATEELENSSLFQHDLVDVTRQALQVLGDGYYLSFVQSFQRKDIASFQQTAENFLELLEGMNEILGTNKHFLLGAWLNNAKKLATSSLEQKIFEFNARNQITLWGPLGEIKDYATKQWAGVVSDYYLPRWQMFVNYLNFCLQERIPYNQTLFDIDVFQDVEEPFTLDTTSFPDVPHGSSILIAQNLHSRWGNSSMWNQLTNLVEVLSQQIQYPLDLDNEPVLTAQNLHSRWGNSSERNEVTNSEEVPLQQIQHPLDLDNEPEVVLI